MLIPKNSGKITLGSATIITTTGDSLTTAPIDIFVKTASEKPEVKSEGEWMPENQEALKKMFFFRLKANKETVRIGEPVQVEVEACTKIDMDNIMRQKELELVNVNAAFSRLKISDEVYIEEIGKEQFACRSLDKIEIYPFEADTLFISSVPFLILTKYYSDTLQVESNSLGIPVLDIDKNQETVSIDKILSSLQNKNYEDIKKEAEKEATPEEGELEQEEKDEISRNAISETLGYAGREGKEGNKINGSYNNTIINDIRLRTEPGKSFPGIQDITFNMFKINEKYSKFSNFFHYMPWGDKLLNNEYVLNSGSTFNFEDSKYLLKNLVVPVYLKFKSINDRYYMEFNNEGVLTLYNYNGTPKTIIQAAYGKNLKDTKNRKIIFDGLNGVLHIQGEPSENNDTISISYPNSKTNKQPYSLILDTSSGNLGKLKIYDLGFNVIFNN
jgi:hypothetical protein